MSGKEKACYLDMPEGLHVPRYPQKFVKAPASLHPQKPQEDNERFHDAEAMRISMGC